MSTNPIVQDFTEVKTEQQLAQSSGMSSSPDYLEYERLKSELSPDLNHHEYSNAVRRIATECGL